MWNFQGTNRFLRGGFDPQIIDIIKYNNQTGYTVDIATMAQVFFSSKFYIASVSYDSVLWSTYKNVLYS